MCTNHGTSRHPAFALACLHGRDIVLWQRISSTSAHTDLFDSATRSVQVASGGGSRVWRAEDDDMLHGSGSPTRVSVGSAGVAAGYGARVGPSSVSSGDAKDARPSPEGAGGTGTGASVPLPSPSTGPPSLRADSRMSHRFNGTGAPPRLPIQPALASRRACSQWVAGVTMSCCCAHRWGRAGGVS